MPYDGRRRVPIRASADGRSPTCTDLRTVLHHRVRRSSGVTASENWLSGSCYSVCKAETVLVAAAQLAGSREPATAMSVPASASTVSSGAR
jgi:hypothetical protein